MKIIDLKSSQLPPEKVAIIEDEYNRFLEKERPELTEAFKRLLQKKTFQLVTGLPEPK